MDSARNDDESAATRGEPRNQLERDFLDYMQVCADHGFDSRQAALFLISKKDPKFLKVANGLRRLLHQSFLENEGSGPSLE